LRATLDWSYDREYGLERLADRGETDAVARRHANYFLALVEQAEPDLLGPRQGLWYERLEAECRGLPWPRPYS
jgi:predicted ATPase